MQLTTAEKAMKTDIWKCLASLNDSKDELVHKIHLSKTKTKKKESPFDDYQGNEHPFNAKWKIKEKNQAAL